MPRFIHKDFERGKVGVPLDQRGHRTKAPERRGMEAPDGFRNSGAVVVNQDIDVFGGVMTGKMDLADRLDRQPIEIGDRIEPEIPGANVDVVTSQRMPQPVRRTTSVRNSTSGMDEWR
jgi:hypothetical protein